MQKRQLQKSNVTSQLLLFSSLIWLYLVRFLTRLYLVFLTKTQWVDGCTMVGVLWYTMVGWCCMVGIIYVWYTMVGIVWYGMVWWAQIS